MEYLIRNEFVIGVTKKGAMFLIDLENLETVKQYNWSRNDKGYFTAHCKISKKTIYLHRLIMNLHDKSKTFGYVDHISSHKNDNRKSNLRICTNAENLQNRKVNSNNSTGIIGVSWNSGCNKYQAIINVNGKQKMLGVFKNIEDATAKRLEAEQEYYAFKNGSTK